MPRKSGLPGYCLHKATGQAVCRVKGKDHYLGKFGTPQSRRAYGELLARLDAGGGGGGGDVSQTDVPRDLTVAELAARYDGWARSYYVKAGKTTGQYERVKRSMALAVGLYGSTLAAGFGPVALCKVRDAMVARGWSRKHVNSCVGCVRRAWRWAASRQLVGADVFDALETLDGLREGKTSARETAPVGSVDDAVVEATLPYLRPETADMVRLQRLTAMRAGEVCSLRAEEIDRSGEVWLWRPLSHKTAHRGRGRVILFGPKAQEVLCRHLANGAGYVFSPKKTMANLQAERRAARRSKRPPSQACARRRVQAPKVAPGECYVSNSYQKAIRDACAAAGVEQWTSHQLRKAAATAIRSALGLEAAQAALGHARADVTQLYAERDLALAIAAARKLG